MSTKQTEALKLALEWIGDAVVVLSHTSTAIQGGIGADAEGVGGCSVGVIAAIREALAEPPAQQQEPVPDTLYFAQWTAAKKDLSDYIHVGSLSLAGIEDGEYGTPEIDPFNNTIETLQEKLVTGSDHKKVPLLAYIGALNSTSQPTQQQELGFYGRSAARLSKRVKKLEAQQQEPVAWMYQCSADSSGPVLTQYKKDWAESGSGLWTETPLYTSPPAKLREKNA